LELKDLQEQTVMMVPLVRKEFKAYKGLRAQWVPRVQMARMAQPALLGQQVPKEYKVYQGLQDLPEQMERLDLLVQLVHKVYKGYQGLPELRERTERLDHKEFKDQ
jgi:hypothetical protein